MLCHDKDCPVWLRTNYFNSLCQKSLMTVNCKYRNVIVIIIPTMIASLLCFLINVILFGTVKLKSFAFHHLCCDYVPISILSCLWYALYLKIMLSYAEMMPFSHLRGSWKFYMAQAIKSFTLDIIKTYKILRGITWYFAWDAGVW